jgi:hypothetical protein
MACSETVARMDAGPKPTWTYSRRVSEQAIVSRVELAKTTYSSALPPHIKIRKPSQASWSEKCPPNLSKEAFF